MENNEINKFVRLIKSLKADEQKIVLAYAQGIKTADSIKKGGD